MKRIAIFAVAAACACAPAPQKHDPLIALLVFQQMQLQHQMNVSYDNMIRQIEEGREREKELEVKLSTSAFKPTPKEGHDRALDGFVTP